MNPLIREKLVLLPELPGCYLMEDLNGNVIYVGKAKRLKRRVHSYFTGMHNPKTAKLVSEIANFTFIVTSSNVDALILEMNLIKRYRPKFNILLKDDKSYPFMKITDERHPRLIITRLVKRDKGKYFGPFPNVNAAKETKKLLDHLYPLRKCPLSATRPCLYYQMGQCIGCCARTVSKEDYDQVIHKIIRFFNGGYKKVEKDLELKMRRSAEQLDFENARKYHELIDSIKATMVRQKINHLDFVDRDVFGYAHQKGVLCIQMFYIRLGKLIQRRSTFICLSDNEPESTVMDYIEQFYRDERHSKPKEIFLPEIIDEALIQLIREALPIRIVCPKRGDKKDWVQLACQNARIALQHKLSLLQSESTAEKKGSLRNISSCPD
ncbi:excinuclease ABC subunit UvrC [Sporolactobacillus sp. STCC-11]|uniref:excinuclease ABC subunit UvrC n=1 Tax=Sporolactobacillus caesalpiniae TaxID=3230362 RepID=UPI00339ABA54